MDDSTTARDAAKGLIVVGFVVLALAAVAGIASALPTPSMLNAESALLVPLAGIVLLIVGVALLMAGLLIDRRGRGRSRI